MKRILLITLSFLCVAAYAQQGSQKGNADITNFPEVSFIWNEYNPDVLDASQFSVKEHGQAVEVKIESLAAESIPQKGKTVLFLWEDQPGNEKQDGFIQQLLYYFFDDLEDNTTTFNIAVFNQKEGKDAVLKLKMPAFTSDKEALKKFISDEVFLWKNDERNNEKTKKTKRQAGRSDLLLAISEGLDLLEKEPAGNIRTIFIITAGYTISEPGVEITPRSSKALQNHIPIYVINYFEKDNNVTETVTRLYQETYGQLIPADGKNDPQAQTTRKELLKCFNELNRRNYGQDYKITFTSLLKRDGKPYSLMLNVKGADSIIPYQTPKFSYSIWIKEHILLFAIVLVLILAAIATGIWFYLKYSRKKKTAQRMKEEEEERQRYQQKAEQEQVKRQLEATQAEMQRRQMAVEQEKINAQEQAREEQLKRQMQAKNLLPRLIDDSVYKVKFNIGNITTTIGREADNDIVLPDSTVSKHHAKIVFNGSAFELHDLNSANGTKVNGERVNQMTLKHLDVIQFGKVSVNFYL